MPATITATELKKIVCQDNVCILDVRRKADFDKSPQTIAGATWHNPEDLADWRKNLPTNKDLVVYCVKGGSVSQSIATALQDSHPTVRFLEGGILGWQEDQQ